MLLYMPLILKMQYWWRTSVLQLVLTVTEKDTAPTHRKSSKVKMHSFSGLSIIIS